VSKILIDAMNDVISVQRADIALLAEGLQRLEYELAEEKERRSNAEERAAALEALLEARDCDVQGLVSQFKASGGSALRQRIADLEALLDMSEREQLALTDALQQRTSEAKAADTER
jgi:hypothetical protein